MMPREKWTDERLDDLQAEMRTGFVRVDGEIKELRREMNARFDSMKNSIDARFDAMNRNMIAGFFVIVTAIVSRQRRPHRQHRSLNAQAVAPTQRSRFCSYISLRISSIP